VSSLAGGPSNVERCSSWALTSRGGHVEKLEAIGGVAKTLEVVGTGSGSSRAGKATHVSSVKDVRGLIAHAHLLESSVACGNVLPHARAAVTGKFLHVREQGSTAHASSSNVVRVGWAHVARIRPGVEGRVGRAGAVVWVSDRVRGAGDTRTVSWDKGCARVTSARKP